MSAKPRSRRVCYMPRGGGLEHGGGQTGGLGLRGDPEGLRNADALALMAECSLR
jgi:hypothetical protein